MTTPADRSRNYAPEEWAEDQILVYIVEPAEGDNWPALPDDPSPRFHRALRVTRNGIVMVMVIGVLWFLVLNAAWTASRFFS